MTNTIISSKIANPYAEALFQLGLSLYLKEDDPNVFFQIIFDIQDLLALLKKTPSLKVYLSDPLVPNQRKKDLLEKCLSEKSNPSTENFLKLLVDKDRINIVENIAQIFLTKSYDFVCLKFVEVYSAFELSEVQQKLLIKKLRTLLGPEFTSPEIQYPNIALSLRIDKKILGGLIIKVGSKIIDLSLLGDLQSLSKQLDITI